MGWRKHVATLSAQLHGETLFLLPVHVDRHSPLLRPPAPRQSTPLPHSSHMPYHHTVLWGVGHEGGATLKRDES